MSGTTLSRRAQAVFDVCCYLEKDGQTVSTESVRRLTGISSTSVVNYHLHKLADRGLLRTAIDVRDRRHIFGVADLPGSPARDLADAIRACDLIDRMTIEALLGKTVEPFLDAYPPVDPPPPVLSSREAISRGHEALARQRPVRRSDA